MFNGASASGGILYDVDDGGKLLAESVWYEGDWPEHTHFDLNSSGDLTVTGMHLAVTRDAAAPVMRFSGHKGMVSFLTSTFLGVGGPGSNLRVAIDGDGTGSKVLLMGNTFWVEGTTAPSVSAVWQDTSSPAAEASLAASSLNGNFTNGFAALPNVTSKQQDVQPTGALALEGLRLLREARMEPPNARPPGVTDVKSFGFSRQRAMERPCWRSAASRTQGEKRNRNADATVVWSDATLQACWNCSRRLQRALKPDGKIAALASMVCALLRSSYDDSKASHSEGGRRWQDSAHCPRFPMTRR